MDIEGKFFYTLIRGGAATDSNKKGGGLSPDRLFSSRTLPRSRSLAGFVRALLLLFRLALVKIIDLRLGLLLKQVALPADQSRAQVLRVHAERLADIVERKQPLGILLQDPLLGLAKQLQTVALARECILLVASHGVFQDREHETRLRLEMRLAAISIQKLCGKQRVG